MGIRGRQRGIVAVKGKGEKCRVGGKDKCRKRNERGATRKRKGGTK